MPSLPPTSSSPQRRPKPKPYPRECWIALDYSNDDEGIITIKKGNRLAAAFPLMYYMLPEHDPPPAVYALDLHFRQIYKLPVSDHHRDAYL